MIHWNLRDVNYFLSPDMSIRIPFPFHCSYLQLLTNLQKPTILMWFLLYSEDHFIPTSWDLIFHAMCFFLFWQEEFVFVLHSLQFMRNFLFFGLKDFSRLNSLFHEKSMIFTNFCLQKIQVKNFHWGFCLFEWDANFTRYHGSVLGSRVGKAVTVDFVLRD